MDSTLTESSPGPSTETLASELAALRSQFAAQHRDLAETRQRVIVLERNLLRAREHAGLPVTQPPRSQASRRAAERWHLPSGAA